jgi:hypothetical protein
LAPIAAPHPDRVAILFRSQPRTGRGVRLQRSALSPTLRGPTAPRGKRLPRRARPATNEAVEKQCAWDTWCRKAGRRAVRLGRPGDCYDDRSGSGNLTEWSRCDFFTSWTLSKAYYRTRTRRSRS